MHPLSETRERGVCLQTQCLSDGAFRTMNSFVGAFALWVWGPRERREDRAGAELWPGGRAGPCSERAQGREDGGGIPEEKGRRGG